MIRCRSARTKDAVSLFERYAKGGEDPKKDWAGKTPPALQHHLEMAQPIDKNRKGDVAEDRAKMRSSASVAWEPRGRPVQLRSLNDEPNR
jgi:hypothetical protein